MKLSIYSEILRIKENNNFDIGIKRENFILLTKAQWRYICSHEKYLSEDFIRGFRDYVHWNAISRFQILSEDFIREFKDRVNWIYISRHQKLSEEFIREFKDRVNWDYILIDQYLSKEFIKEMGMSKRLNDIHLAFLSDPLGKDKIKEEKILII